MHEIDFTSGGSIRTADMSFHSITYSVIEKAHSLLTSTHSQLQTDVQIFGRNYTNLKNQRHIEPELQYFYYLKENTMGSIPLKFTELIDMHQSYEISQTSKYKNIILLFAAGCSVILLLSSLLILPFLFGVDLSELKMIEMTINLNKTFID